MSEFEIKILVTPIFILISLLAFVVMCKSYNIEIE